MISLQLETSERIFSEEIFQTLTFSQDVLAN